MGWKPTVQGGNGKPPPVPQMLLASALGWQMEVSIATGRTRKDGYPPAYKADIAEPALKVAIEVDGMSHSANDRKEQDLKKEECLRGLGWTVLRFSNLEVTEHLAECVQTVMSTISKSKAPTPTLPTGL